MGHPIPALSRAKATYERAHNAAVERVRSLGRLYVQTAYGLTTVANNYDVTDMRGSPYEQEAR